MTNLRAAVDVALRQEALDFLARHNKMVLAIDNHAAHPNTSIMHYAVEKHNFTMYFGTRKVFEKYALLQNNARVSCIVLADGIDPVRTVSIHGTARELTGMEYDLAYALFKANNTSVWYIEGSDDISMFAIHPQTIHLLDGSSGVLETHDLAIECRACDD